MPQRANETLILSPTQLAILVRVLDDPGVHASAIADRVPHVRRSALLTVCGVLANRGYLRRGKRYWAHKGGYPRTPLFLTEKGKTALNAHMLTIAGMHLA